MSELNDKAVQFFDALNCRVNEISDHYAQQAVENNGEHYDKAKKGFERVFKNSPVDELNREYDAVAAMSLLPVIALK